MEHTDLNAEADLKFLRNIQRLLDESIFTATYKFALLQALADLSIEREADVDGRLRISVLDIAGKFIEYYWPHAVPFSAGREIQQSTRGQADVIQQVREVRSRYDGQLSRAKTDSTGWTDLQRDVGRIVRTMPLWKLQTVGRVTDEFLYCESDFSGGEIVLLPGVARAFRNFHGLVTHLVRSGWMTKIHRIKANADILGRASDLGSFLFGTESQATSAFRSDLYEHQAGSCFYCRNPLREVGEVDHFIPWVRYPLHLGQNLVLTHAACNNAKGDFLAAMPHLERWRDTHLKSAPLDERLIEAGLPRDASRAHMVAAWAYEQGFASRAQLWLRAKEFESCDYRWTAALGAAP